MIEPGKKIALKTERSATTHNRSRYHRYKREDRKKNVT